MAAESHNNRMGGSCKGGRGDGTTKTRRTPRFTKSGSFGERSFCCANEPLQEGGVAVEGGRLAGRKDESDCVVAGVGGVALCGGWGDGFGGGLVVVGAESVGVRVRNFLAWVGLAMVVLACVPMAWWGYGELVAVFEAWFVFWNLGKAGKWGRVVRVGSAVGLVGVLAAMVVHELPYRGMREVEGAKSDHLVVIGDSMSAGIGGGSVAWPVVFERETGVRVVNLGAAGDWDGGGGGVGEEGFGWGFAGVDRDWGE